MKRFIRWFMSFFSVREERCDEDKVVENPSKVSFEDELAKYDVKITSKNMDYYFPRIIGKIKTKLKIFDKELIVPNFKIRYEPLGDEFGYEGEYYATMKEVTFTKNGLISCILEEEFPCDGKYNERPYLVPMSGYGHLVLINKDFPYETYHYPDDDKHRSRRFKVTKLCYHIVDFYLGLGPIPHVLSTLPEEERLEFYEKFSYITKHISDHVFFKTCYGKGLSFREAVEKNLEIFKTREYTL